MAGKIGGKKGVRRSGVARKSPSRPAASSRARPAGSQRTSKGGIHVQRKAVIRRAGSRGARPLPVAPSRRPVRQPRINPAMIPMPNLERMARSGAGISNSGGGDRQAAIVAQRHAELNMIRSRFAGLEADAQLGDIYQAIGQIDARLLELPIVLNEMRDRNYVHSGSLEDKLEKFDEGWDKARISLESALKEHVGRLNREMDQTEQELNRMSVNNSAQVSAAHSSVEGLERQINAARSALKGLYRKYEQELNQINQALHRVDHVLDMFEESPDIRLNDAEGPLAVAEVEWLRDGDEGPEGLLLITDQRIFFEQKEEIKTKKFFGLVTTNTETIQKLMLEAMVHDIETIKHRETGGFLGLNKEDVLELIFTANAPISRADFRLKEERASVWAGMIKKVQTGGIDDERAEDYLEEVEEAAALLASFPTQCPNCFGPVTPPQRGVTNLSCEFCGTIITGTAPEVKAETAADDSDAEKKSDE